MALIARHNFWLANPIKNFGGGTHSHVRNNFSETGAVRNQYAGGYANYNATPRGYLPPYSRIMPQVGGGLASTSNALNGTISMNAAVLVSGFPISSSMSATIVITDAALGLIVALEAALAASGLLTSADLAATLGMITAMSASGQITDSTLGAIVGIVSSMYANGTLTATTLVGLFMEWNVGGPAELSSEGLAVAVWNYLKENETVNGSMKEELQKARTAAENAFAVSS